jgi:hypothetical protein
MFKLYCDRCKKEVREVGGPEAKNISLNGAFICKACVEYEKKLLAKTEKLKSRWDRIMANMINEAKDELLNALKEESN